MARKANGLGHTYKVGSSYKTRIRHKGIEVTATGKTAQESRQKAKAKIEQLPVNYYKPKRVKLKVGEFISQWLEEEHRPGLAHKTYLRYEGLLRLHVTPNIGKYTLQEVNVPLINWLLNQMRDEGLSGRSLQQTRTLLSVAFRAAQDKGLIGENPVSKVRNPQYQAREIQPLNLEEMRRLLSTFSGTSMGARLHVALLCGLRQGEALGLRWGDVDLQRGLIRVVDQIQRIEGKAHFVPLKTHRSRRTIALTQETITALKMQKEIVLKAKLGASAHWEDLDLVFPSHNGSPLVAKTDYDNWKRALKLCGVAPRRLHDARHSAATLMYASGVPIETISRALGHSTSAITSRLYVHNAEEPLKHAAQLIQSALDN